VNDCAGSVAQVITREECHCIIDIDKFLSKRHVIYIILPQPVEHAMEARLSEMQVVMCDDYCEVECICSLSRCG
jgi:hypothetical protein